jgi:hypothetical protein
MRDLIIKHLNESNLTKSDIKDEVKTQLDSNSIKKKVEDIVSAKLKNNKELEDKIVEITKDVLAQLHKTLWVKKNVIFNNIK